MNLHARKHPNPNKSNIKLKQNDKLRPYNIL